MPSCPLLFCLSYYSGMDIRVPVLGIVMAFVPKRQL